MARPLYSLPLSFILTGLVPEMVACGPTFVTVPCQGVTTSVAASGWRQTGLCRFVSCRDRLTSVQPDRPSPPGPVSLWQGWALKRLPEVLA